MSCLTHGSNFRWKEWMPLITQQQRLRGLIQIIGYNIKVDKSKYDLDNETTIRYYFTVHLPPVPTPIYTSEKLSSENPKWAELDIDSVYGAASGFVIKIWAALSNGSDEIITSWGVNLSGLVHLGSRLTSADPTSLQANSLVFHMTGGYFTAPHCFIHPQPAVPRTLSVQLSTNQIRPSYSVQLLQKLQSMQHSNKKQVLSANSLRDRILLGEIGSGHGDGAHSWTYLPPGRTSSVLKRLLSKPKPPPPREVLALKRQIEEVKFRVDLASQELDRRKGQLQVLRDRKDKLIDHNEDKSSDLMERYCRLQKETEKLREHKRQNCDNKTQLGQVNTLLDLRRKQLMSELAYIYPIVQASDGKYLIRGVWLPDSEVLEGKEGLSMSVALGFVAHLVQMISIFLNVPTRYPLINFGLRTKIIDHILDLPDNRREFPLYCLGKDKLQFQYGVFLLNKNIAQLRWCCGLSTTNLPATLSNLAALMSLSPVTPLNRRERGLSGGSGPEDSGGGSSSASPGKGDGMEKWRQIRTGTSSPEVRPSSGPEPVIVLRQWTSDSPLVANKDPFEKWTESSSPDN